LLEETIPSAILEKKIVKTNFFWRHSEIILGQIFFAHKLFLPLTAMSRRTGMAFIFSKLETRSAAFVRLLEPGSGIKFQNRN